MKKDKEDLDNARHTNQKQKNKLTEKDKTLLFKVGLLTPLLFTVATTALQYLKAKYIKK